MTQIHDDSWDITEGLSATALGMALAHADESNCSCPLFTDRYAQLFIDAATERGWDPSVTAERLPTVRSYAAVRTKWFDEYFIAAGANGIDQSVLLAAGLDARAWRLPWVHGSALYEIDQPEVLAFKSDTLAQTGARPATRYRAVPSDLQADWPTALRNSGFDPATPTAWSAEGLLPELPAAGQPLLFERIVELSALGSRIAAEALSPSEHLTEWLAERDWEVTVIEAVKVMERYGRPPEGELEELASRSVFIEARLI
jgi:methyltransferase (TIGR00027 family)